MTEPTKNKWSQPVEAPPPLFLGPKERNLVKQVNDELIERVIGQGVFYYPVDMMNTDYHPVYGEAINKNFLPPVRVYALVVWEGYTSEATKFGLDKKLSIIVHFHKRRLVEDQDMYVREGDFVRYGETFYEIVSWNQPKQIFGQTDHQMEIEVKCVKARQGVFDAT